MFFSLFAFIADLVLISFVYILAYIIKFKINLSWNLSEIGYGNYVNHAQIEPYLHLLYIIVIVWSFSLILFGVYKERRGVLSGIDESINIVKASFLSTALIIASTFLFYTGDYSRHVFGYGAILSVLFISINHQFNFKLRSLFRNKSRNCKRAIVVGTDESAQHVYARIMLNEKHQYDLQGAFGNKPNKLIYAVEEKFNYQGKYEELLDFVSNNKIDTVFVVTQELSINLISELMEKLIEFGVTIKLQPSFLEVSSGKLESSDDLGMAFFSIKPSELSGLQFFCKRACDLVLAIPVLVLLSPFILLIAFLIKFSDKGSAFFSQERTGLKGKEFMMYKFRTMPENIEKETGPMINTESISNRATWIGKILRKTSLDELPQLLNIIKGDMSIVGPRPERPMFVEQFKNEYPDYDLRHRVLPGLTGWAQLNGRAALSTRVNEKLMYDLYYINNWTLLFDVKIVIKTLIYVLTWQGAY